MSIWRITNFKLQKILYETEIQVFYKRRKLWVDRDESAYDTPWYASTIITADDTFYYPKYFVTMRRAYILS